MDYITLGNSDLKVSEISFGCMSLMPDPTLVQDLIHAAVDSGINFFDTADLYQKGANETMLGKALGRKRSSVYIATKVGNQLREEGSGWRWNPSKKYILEAVDNSLSRLNTDYIDLYQLHGGTIEDPIDETIEAFEELKTIGKIRHYGISSIRPNVIKEYIRKSGIVSIMMQYSLLDRRPEEECLDLLNYNNIGLLSRGSLAKGMLAGKPSNSYLNYSIEEIEEIMKTIQNFGFQQTQYPGSQLAISYVLNHPVNSSAVIGIRTKDQLKDVLNYYKLPKILNQLIQSLKDKIPQNKYSQHR